MNICWAGVILGHMDGDKGWSPVAPVLALACGSLLYHGHPGSRTFYVSGCEYQPSALCGSPLWSKDPLQNGSACRGSEQISSMTCS